MMKVNKNNIRLKLLKKIVGDERYRRIVNSDLKGKVILIPKKYCKAKDKIIELYLLNVYSKEEISIRTNCCKVYVDRIIEQYKKGIGGGIRRNQ